MLGVIYAEFDYAECHYAECQYAECRGATYTHGSCFVLTVSSLFVSESLKLLKRLKKDKETKVFQTKKILTILSFQTTVMQMIKLLSFFVVRGPYSQLFILFVTYESVQ